MKLLVVINSLELGGAERLLYEQLRVGQGRWDARVVCLDSLGTLSQALTTLGIKLTELKLSGRWDPRAISRLRRIFRSWQPDVVHLHLPRSAFFGRLASIGLPHKVVYTEHNTWDIYSLPARCLNAVTYHLNDEVIAVSGAVAAFVGRRLGSSPRQGRPIVIPNGVDVNRLRDSALSRLEARRQLGLNAEDLVVGNVANLFARKGQKYLIEAATQVVAHVPGAQFVLVGAGDQEGILKAQAANAGLADRVLFTGALRDACRFMRAFDVFCLPSLYEGMPVALLEAMALGIPVVATVAGGNAEVVQDDATGSLVPIADSNALAAALLRLLGDDSLRRSMGAAALDSIQQHFSIASLVESYDRVYQKVM